jgi:hypothetical protein
MIDRDTRLARLVLPMVAPHMERIDAAVGRRRRRLGSALAAMVLLAGGAVGAMRLSADDDPPAATEGENRRRGRATGQLARCPSTTSS